MQVLPHILIRSGHNFNFINPEKNIFTVQDIAHALSNICRFGGHTKTFYSVAQHSILASLLVPSKLAYAALFHDAAEAFIGDIPQPLKQIIPDYQEIEKRVETVVFKKLGISQKDAKNHCIKKVDRILLSSEKRDLMPDNDDEWILLQGIKPIEERIIPISSMAAFSLFMQRYENIKRDK